MGIIVSVARADDLGQRRLYDRLKFYAQTSGSNGGAVDADSAPTYRVYEDETGSPLITGSMALLDSSNNDGLYSEAIDLTPANGFERGKTYVIRFSAPVSSVTKVDFHTFTIHANEIVVQHDGSNSTSGSTAESRIEAATAGAVVVLGAGVFDMGSAELTVPADVTIRGAGNDATRIKSSIATRFVIPGDRSVIEHMTIEASANGGRPVGAGTNQQFDDAVLRDARLIGDDDCVHILGTSASSITIERVWMYTDFDGIVTDGAAHRLWVRDVFITGVADGSVSSGIITGDATHFRGTRINVNISDAPLAVGVSATETSLLELFDSSIYVDTGASTKYSVNVADATAKARLINCEFDRSLKAGQTAQIEDLCTCCN